MRTGKCCAAVLMVVMELAAQTAAFWVFAIAGFTAPAAVAGQQSEGMGWGQRQDPAAQIQTSQAQGAASSNKERAMGICAGIYNPTGKTYPEFLSPAGMTAGYFSLYENRMVDEPPLSNVELVVQPKHGKVVYSKLADGLLYPAYIPELDYEGDEKLVFKVRVDGTTVRVVYLLKVTRMFTDSGEVQDSLCKKTGTQWKISPPDVPADEK